MLRRDMTLALAAALALTPTPAIAIQGEGAVAPAAVDARVRAVLDGYQAAWNAADMDAMGRLYARDVHWVNIVGMHWQGFAAVDRAHRVFFDLMFKGVPLKLEAVESVRALPGGAKVVVARWSVGQFKTPAGTIVPPSRDRMTLVLVPDGERLLIAHGANIQIDEKAQANDPVRSGAKPLPR